MLVTTEWNYLFWHGKSSFDCEMSTFLKLNGLMFLNIMIKKRKLRGDIYISVVNKKKKNNDVIAYFSEMNCD